MNEQRINDIFSYSLSIRRKLHMYPEVGFELPKTVAIIGEECIGLVSALPINTANAVLSQNSEAVNTDGGDYF